MPSKFFCQTAPVPGGSPLREATLGRFARIPVDDPATHLELTMVHEAMVLEYSGRHLAMIKSGSKAHRITQL